MQNISRIKLMFAAAVLLMALPFRASALTAKLPYAQGESFVVSQGYDTPPTHIKKDAYALDFTQDGCDAYGEAVVAAAPGTAMFVGEEGYNGGYGTELIIDHGEGIVSRYAHMIPDSITVGLHDDVRRGEAVGLVGDTGLVAGAACAEHPGTHLHFAMDTVGVNGAFIALDPEPISGYTNMTAGRWYRSDNGPDENAAAPANAATGEFSLGAALTLAAPDAVTAASSSGQVLGAAITSSAPGAFGAASSSFNDTSFASSIPTSSASVSIPVSTATIPAISSSGGVVALAAPVMEEVKPSPASSTTDDTAGDTQNDASSSTPSAPTDATSTAEPSSASPASDVIFEQTIDGDQSPGSWYDDNWFTLGNGFSGTVNALTLEGKVNDPHYLASHVALQEFSDPAYSTMVRQFTLSDDAPFTPVLATATFSGLSIPLRPYFYYRLATIQDWQNRSVILAGTASTTVGTVMWDNFIYGIGGVQSTSTFFPYIIMEGTSSSTEASPLTAPSNINLGFDEVNMQLEPSFAPSTDADWPADPIDFEMNYTTSTTLSASGWTPVVTIPVVFNNTYLVGIRGKNNFGDISPVATATWSFPAGWSPYILSRALGHAFQGFTVPATSTLLSIKLFTDNFTATMVSPGDVQCSLMLRDDDDGTTISSDNTETGYACAPEPIFSFASSSLVLHPGDQYHWIFQFTVPENFAGVQFYGTMTNTVGGLFSDPSLVNAKFAVYGDGGVILQN